MSNVLTPNMSASLDADYEKPYLRLTVTNISGWDPCQEVGIIRKQPDSKGQLVQDGNLFYRRLDQTFDCHLKPGRVVILGVVEKAYEQNKATCNFLLQEISDMCLSKEGQRISMDFNLVPKGTITISAQRHPRRDRGLLRRGAQKVAKIHIYSGHHFVAQLFKEETTCYGCKNAFCGFQALGLQCNFCQIKIHRACKHMVKACPNVDQSTAAIQASSVDEYDEYDYALYKYPAAIQDAAAYERSQQCPWLFPSVPYNLTRNFKIICLLGRGSFGKVYLARFTADSGDKSMLVALKAIRKDKVALNLEATRIERNVLQVGSKSPFILHLLCTFQSEDHFFYAVDFVAGGTIIFHLINNGKFDVHRARFYAAEVVCALEFLHGANIIYRDLKAENVMLDLSGHIRLVDFGLAKDSFEHNQTTRTICGTVSHMAPEIILSQPYSYAVDWWSFGVFLFEMLAGRLPFYVGGNEINLSNLASLNRQFDDSSLPSFCGITDEEAISLLKLLFHRSPERRLGGLNCPAGSVRTHSFFRPLIAEFDWDLISTGSAKPPVLPEACNRDPIQVPQSDNFVDVSYFELDFVYGSVTQSRIEEKLARTMNATLFPGFSMINPEYSESSPDGSTSGSI